MAMKYINNCSYFNATELMREIPKVMGEIG